MAVETELKLRIAPEHLKRLRRHPVLEKLAAGRAVTRKLHSIYYDTPDLVLRGRRMALRLRRDGRQWLQTMKGGGGVKAGLHSRNEWETPVDGDILDFDALEAVGSQRLPAALRRKLRPVFLTEFVRTSRLLSFGGADIEVCMDSGEIRAGRKRHPISEIELELKSGEPVQLFRLAQALLDIVPMEVEHVSKAEHGYRLYAGIAPAPLKAQAPDIGDCRDVSCVLHAMVESCLAHLQANVPGVQEGRDEEFLHQVRVALRRLRVALAVAQRRSADATLPALRTEVAELCTTLGILREWDVFVTQTLKSVPSRSVLVRDASRQRDKHLADVQDRLQAPEYQRLLLELGAWLHGDYWQATALHTSLPRKFAAKVLDRRRRQAGKLGRRIARADAGQLHALRIACKKLRYGVEMLAPFYAQERAGRYRGTLSALQDTLGGLNDIASARRLLGELEAGRAYPGSAAVRKRLDRDEARLRTKLGSEWKKFSERKAFWRLRPEKFKA